MTQPVLSGVSGDLQWHIDVTGDTQDMGTFIVFRRGTAIVGERGFGGPPLHPGRAINIYKGVGDGTPYVVIARVSPTVTRVAVDWTAQPATDALLTDVLDDYGVRIAVAVSAGNSEPLTVQAFTDTTPVE